MSPPRVKIGGIRLHVLCRRRQAMRVKDELVRTEEETTDGALDALSARGVVAGREEGSATAPGTLVVNAESKILGQPRRRIVA